MRDHQVPSSSDVALRFGAIRTEDGTVIALDPASGLSVSGLTMERALADLARLTAARAGRPRARPGEAAHPTGRPPPG